MTWPKTFVACASALTIAACGPAACGPAAEPQVEVPPPAPTSQLAVTDAWARAADSGAMSSVYFTLENTGVVPDTLTGVRTEAADGVGLHMSMDRNRMMTMAALRTLPVPATDSVLFRPLGAHVMLTGLARALVAGDTVRVTLEFVSGKSIAVRAGVREP